MSVATAKLTVQFSASAEMIRDPHRRGCVPRMAGLFLSRVPGMGTGPEHTAVPAGLRLDTGVFDFDIGHLTGWVVK